MQVTAFVFHDVQHGAGDATSPEVSPLRTSCGSCLNTATMQQQQPIISMEEDEMSDQEVVSTDQLRTLLAS
jgi:hypothetical protein